MKSILIIAIIFLTGCASQQIPHYSGTPVPPERKLGADFFTETNETVEINITRDYNYRIGTDMIRIYTNGEMVADMKKTENLRFYLAPGHYIISAVPISFGGGLSRELSITIQTGMVSNFRIGRDYGGEMIFTPTAF